MMRTMRANAKWVFFILSTAFVGWLAYGQVMEILGPGTNVILEVNGSDVSLPDYQRAIQTALEQARQQGRPALTREEEREIENRVVDELIQDLLLRAEYRRLGITVTDDEIRAAARTSPLPEIQQAPDFQTDGRFDIEKYQRFLRTAPPQFLQVLESRYREQIPRVKLLQYLTADSYVSDGRLWRVYRDQHDSVRVLLVTLWPNSVPDSLAPVTDDELERYYRDHRDDFKRPAVAFVSYTALDRRPDPADTAASLARARALRAEAMRGGADGFAEVARRASADSVSAAQGGDLGWFAREGSGFDAQFLDGVRRLRPGEVSEPVLTQFGFHVIRLEASRGDSMRARHILVPVELRPDRLDEVESRADSLDRLAADQVDPAVLDSAVRRLGLPLARARVVDGERMQLGRFVVPDVSVWAFETRPGETSPVIEGSQAYYVFRLDSLIPEGTPPLAAIREPVLAAARREKQKAVLGDRASELARQLAQGPNLAAGAAAAGVAAQPLGPFSRLTPPGVLAQEPLVLGAAFGLRVGERSGIIRGKNGFFVVELSSRTPADSAAWLAQREAQRSMLIQRVRETRVTAYLSGLRQQAKIVDRRRELLRSAPEAAPAIPGF